MGISRGERFNILDCCGWASHKRMSALGQKPTLSAAATTSASSSLGGFLGYSKRGAVASRRLSSRLSVGHDLALTSSSDGIIAQNVGFQFHFAEPVFENIADTNDPHKVIAVFDGQVSNAPLRHELHDIGDTVLR